MIAYQKWPQVGNLSRSTDRSGDITLRSSVPGCKITGITWVLCFDHGIVVTVVIVGVVSFPRSMWLNVHVPRRCKFFMDLLPNYTFYSNLSILFIRYLLIEGVTSLMTFNAGLTHAIVEMWLHEYVPVTRPLLPNKAYTTLVHKFEKHPPFADFGK